MQLQQSVSVAYPVAIPRPGRSACCERHELYGLLEIRKPGSQEKPEALSSSSTPSSKTTSSVAADHPEVVKWEPTWVYLGEIFRDDPRKCALDVQLERPVDIYHAMRLVIEYIEQRGLRGQAHGPLGTREFGYAGGSTSKTPEDNLAQVRYAYESTTTDATKRQMVMTYVKWGWPCGNGELCYDPILQDSEVAVKDVKVTVP
ncbi:hypothetical protein LTR27_009234 [Elasticomyces elasticus]|nr:hypothetical protein LTR27_009234 [Elasticomyces elasticus]